MILRPRQPSKTFLTPVQILMLFTLRTLNAKLGALIPRNEINIPVRHAIPLIVRAGEWAWAENVILKHQLADIEKILTTRKEYKIDCRAI